MERHLQISTEGGTSPLEQVDTDNVTTATYTYDANGNRLTKVTSAGTESATYDAQDRLTTYGTKTYTYGANGELATETDSATSTTKTFVYDAIGNLKSVSWPGTTIEYLVDGEGHRIQKKVNGTVKRRWLWRGPLQLIAELDGSNNVTARFVYGSNANVPDLVIKSGATYRIIKDHLGSPRIVTDTATNTPVQVLAYDEFGNVTDSNPGFQPFGFAGGLCDPERVGEAGSPLVRFGARDYDPKIGRWTAKDPIRFDGGLNLYGYCNNDPTNCLDPTGHWPDWLDKAFDSLRRAAFDPGKVGSEEGVARHFPEIHPTQRLMKPSYARSPMMIRIAANCTPSV